jgi:sugar lactone lactonase YvrE
MNRLCALLLLLTVFTARSLAAGASPTPSATTAAGGPLVTTLAGTGSGGFGNGTGIHDVMFNDPNGLVTDPSGNVYIADAGNNMIRKITPDGVVTTLAGFAGSYGFGSENGVGTAASFNGPMGIAMDASGNFYVADSVNCLVRKITPAGVVTTLAGTVGVTGSANGSGTAASFNDPYSVAVDSSGNIYVADYGNNLIRKITPAGVVTTLAVSAGGTGSANAGAANAGATSFKDPSGMAFDSSGNLYVADAGNNLIRKITPAGVMTTLAGSAGVAGSANGNATAALFYGPFGVTVDASGNVYVADSGNELIRKIAP